MVDPEEKIDKPPVFRSWKGWYIFLLAFLGGQIILFYWLTRLYS
jgi:hypothetical protein